MGLTYKFHTGEALMTPTYWRFALRIRIFFLIKLPTGSINTEDNRCLRKCIFDQERQVRLRYACASAQSDQNIRNPLEATVQRTAWI